MRILIDASCIGNRTTGLGRYAYELLNALKEIDKNNFYNVIVSTRLSEDHPVFLLNSGNFRLLRMPVKGTGLRRQFLCLFRRFPKKFDVYHYLHFDVPLFSPHPSIVTIHDLKHLAFPEFFRRFSGSKALFQKWKMKWAVRNCKFVIAVSESTKNDIIRYLQGEPSKIKVIYEGVSNLIR
jgi:glycosyltransferase involved in cell wall biosynthesis